jgi:hypothetical protein
MLIIDKCLGVAKKANFHESINEMDVPISTVIIDAISPAAESH